MSLSTMQQRVFVLFAPGKDVPIVKLFRAAWPDADRTNDNRMMQQKLGPVIARINRRLTKGYIEPGQLKQTYRLTLQKD
jgi:hypothetical protein